MKLAFAITVLFAAVSLAQPIPLANPSFEGDVGESGGWHLSSGAGEPVAGGVDGARAIGVSGAGDDTNYWRQDVPLDPHAFYAVEFSIKKVSGVDGTPITGPVFCNRDLPDAGDDWERVTNYFVTPDTITPENSWLRFGQWHVDGTLLFDDVQVWRAQAVHRRFGDIVLGEGERIVGTTYDFEPTWSSSCTNQTRPMVGQNCYFNTNRFVFGAGSHVVFHHTLPGRMQQRATVTLSTTHYENAPLIAEISRDGEAWEPLASLTKDADHASFDLPAAYFPAAVIWVRLTAPGAEQLHQESPLGSVTLGGYRFQAELDGEPVDLVGETDYVQVRGADPNVAVTILSVGAGRDEDDNAIVMELASTDGKMQTVKPTITLRHPGAKTQVHSEKVRVGAKPVTVTIPYDISLAGPYRYSVSLGKSSALRMEGHFTVSELFASGYGERLPDSGDDVALWWASSGWKVSRKRAVPETRGRALQISAACNEREAAQFVVKPTRPLTNFTIDVAPLEGPNGRAIPLDNLDVLRVHYVNVTQPTDSTSVAAQWPGPLPPIDEPLALAAHENQPFWVRVYVPTGTPAGIYVGAIELRAEGYNASVPLEVAVFDFALPDRPTCVSAFGFSPHTVFQYQNVHDPEQQRAVMAKYLENFSAHRISPYDPTPLDDPGVTWPEVKPGDAVDPNALEVAFDWTAWDAALDAAFHTYHFTSMRLPVAGLGGGTFHSRTDPTLLGFAEDTPEYKAMFRSYWGQLQEHLREKGLLDESYIYWFDEPDPKDYDFVMNGFRKLEEAAPDIPRMLTEQVEEGLVGGPNLWCPISFHYDHEDAESGRSAGERFWWYVCTAPKAPYATLFLDHPAIELRAWLWQTWQRNIDGILVWATNYWTSGSAYPDHPQNPYEDPMSWTSGYSTKAGQRLPWGNGDGRFIYPPLAAANADPAEPVLDGPVDSIRWEMLRDGVEDYEYLAILERLIEEKRGALSEDDVAEYIALLEVPAAITEDMTTFTKDPAPIEQRRKEIAEAIEKLQR